MKKTAPVGEFLENLIATILGRKGMGKSFLTAQIINQENRVIILDTMGEKKYQNQRTRIVWGRDAGIRAMAAAAKERRFRLSLRGLDAQGMLDALEMAYEIEDHMIVTEEASMICRASYLPDQMAQLVRYGRHRRISQLYIARRPSELPRDLTAQSDLIVTLQQREFADIKYLRAAGFDERELLALRALPDDKARGYILVHGDLSSAPLPVIEQLQRQKPLPGAQTKMALTDEPDEIEDAPDSSTVDEEGSTEEPVQ